MLYGIFLRLFSTVILLRKKTGLFYFSYCVGIGGQNFGLKRCYQKYFVYHCLYLGFCCSNRFEYIYFWFCQINFNAGMVLLL